MEPNCGHSYPYNDLLRNRAALPGDLSERNLSDKNRGNKGLLDLLVFKRDMLCHLTGPWLDSTSMADKPGVQEVMPTHEMDRKSFSGNGEHATYPRDLTWCGALTSAAQMFSKLVGDLV